MNKAAVHGVGQGQEVGGVALGSKKGEGRGREC